MNQCSIRRSRLIDPGDEASERKSGSGSMSKDRLTQEATISVTNDFYANRDVAAILAVASVFRFRRPFVIDGCFGVFQIIE